jgi:hypothetical protein
VRVKRKRREAMVVCAIVLSLFCANPSKAYSVLTHEAIIDAAWDTHIRPALLRRFPESTPEQLREAHAYAYGGAIIQDMGYYPHGSKFFSDLAHYVRSGDFVVALLRDSQDLDEYAFAIGALSHYAADNAGHRLAINVAVPLLYPELRKKYGNVVTYEDDPLAHVKTEFGFDVLEVAKERYAPQSYHDFIGFAVAQSLLERAFQETYGLELRSVFHDEDRAIESYRHSVSSLIPKAAKVAWQLKQNDIRRDIPGMTRQKFLYNLSRASYEKEWGKNYQKPSFGDRFLAILYRLVPKVGPLRVLEFRAPTPQTEKLFESSFNITLNQYQTYLAGVRQDKLDLPNDNIDVGEQTARGAYRLNDAAYAQLLEKLVQEQFVNASPPLRADLLQFFETRPDSPKSKLNEKGRIRLQEDVEKLRNAMAISSVPNPAEGEISSH